MRQSWYETAKKNLKDGERLTFYELCYEYEFYGKEPDSDLLTAGVAIMFDMVKSSLEQDIERALKISVRNRRNGLLGGRPKAGNSELQKEQNPTKPNETQENPAVFLGLPNTSTNTITKTNTITSANQDEEVKEKFQIGMYFFEIGVVKVADEVERFWNYYAARGWEVSRGVPVRDKIALAKSWNCNDITSDFIDIRRPFVDLIKSINPEEIVLLSGYVSMIFRETGPGKKLVILKFRQRVCIDLLESKYIKQLVSYFQNLTKKNGCKYDLQYDIRD